METKGIYLLNYKKINTPKYGYYIKNDKMIINKEEQSINKFILNTYNQSLSSIKFTNHLFHLLNLLKNNFINDLSIGVIILFLYKSPISCFVIASWYASFIQKTFSVCKKLQL